jgi:hypothetical protein
MNVVEQRHRQVIDQMTPAQRVKRAAEMWNWARDVIARQVREEFGELSEKAMKYQIALRFYGNDPKMRRLLEEFRARVSP